MKSPWVPPFRQGPTRDRGAPFTVPDQGRSFIFHPNPEAWKAGLFLCLTHLSSPTGIDHEVTETCKHSYGGKTAVSTKALL